MAKIKKIKEGTATVYPATIPQAVIDPTSGKSVRTELNEKEAVANKKQTVTNSATDYPSGAAVTASLALKTDIAELNKIYPLYNYNVRVGTDSGSIGNIEKLAKLYNENLALLGSTVFLWSGVAGMKTRTSGSNQFASKLYNMANKVQQFGADLVTNGTFTGADGSTPAGWTGNGSTITVDSNKLKSISTVPFGNAYQGIATIIGKTYHLSYSFTYVDCQGEIKVSNAVGGVAIISRNLLATTSSTISFVATSTTTFISLVNYSGTTGLTTIWDNISVKQMDWIEGTNDAVQTTEANQPYLGGLIAPNEVGKLKERASSALNISKTIFASNDSFTTTYIFSKTTTTNALVSLSSSSTIYIGVERTAIRLYTPLGTSYVPYTTEIGKINILTVVKIPGYFYVYVNGKYIDVVSIVDDVYEFYGLPAASHSLYHAQIFNRALSASEIQAQHEYLRLQIPEIEGVAIGNQYWATSNYEGVVAGDGSVIQEVQNSDLGANVILNGTFDSTANWTTIGESEITGGVARVYSSVGALTQIEQGSRLTIGKRYKMTYDVTASNNAAITITGAANTIINTAIGTAKEFWFIATEATFMLKRVSGTTDVSFDNIVIQEVGWSGSTALYDAIYAQTSGSTAQKELAAIKAAAMWCYYNNDVNNGAIYGKLYNWYAVKLISLYPPQGYRVPTSADFTQLQTYLGGSTVAGGKIKKEGLTYWSSLNTGATNESGLSAVAGGFRVPNGSFANIGSFCWFARADSVNSIALRNNSADITISDNYIVASPINGASLRLLRNSPVGPNEKTITSTTIASDIASTANSTQIPFGYSVASIRLRTTANLTNIKVELWNNFYSGTPALVSTLITGKTANNTTMVFPVLADAAALLQDGTLRITATGAAAFETVVEYNLQKNTF